MKATSTAGSAAKAGGTSPGANPSAGTGDAVSLLKQDHRNVEALFAKFEKAADISEKSQIVKQICRELIIHTLLEEEIFYPACRQHDDEEPLDEAQIEHDGAKVLITDLLRHSPEDDFYDAKVKVLAEYIKHHVGEEEKPGAGIFAMAQKAGLDMKALGERLLARKKDLMERAEADDLPSPMTRALDVQLNRISKKEESMNRQSNIRDRDDRGRFMSDDEDDDRRYSRGNGGRSMRRDDDYDDRRRGWSGDPEGHSQASRRGWEGRRSDERYGDDDDRGYRSRGRYEDDDYDDRRRGGGRSSDEGRGWYGDPRGHSEASRMGWEERRGGRYDDDDDRRGSRSRSRYEDDDDRRSGGRDHGGWYGDPEGHSRASERGWEERRGSGSSSRRSSGYDDDDDRRSGGRGHGGWYGDSRGHSEASRRGWRDR